MHYKTPNFFFAPQFRGIRSCVMTIKQSTKFTDVSVAGSKKAGSANPPQNLEKPLEIQEIKTENANICRAIQQSFKRKVQNARKNPSKFGTAELNAVITEIDAEIKKNKNLEHSGVKLSMNGRQVMAQLADLKSSTTSHDNVQLLSAMQADLEALLPSILDRELYHWFVSEMIRYKDELEILKSSALHSETVFRKENYDTVLRQRIATMKGYTDVSALRGDVMKSVEVCAAVPKAIRELLFHPVWLSRKFEKEFTVVVDKSGDTHSKNDGACIAGSAKDVDACVLKMENLDISGKKTLILDGRTISTILGPGGSSAFELEKQCNVLLYAPAGSVELTLFGSEKDVEKALKLIGPLKEFANDAGIITERIQCLTCVAKAIDTDYIQQNSGVTITLGPSEELPGSSWLTIRGPNECVSNAMHEVVAQISATQVEKIPACAELLFVTGRARAGLAEAKLMIRWNELKTRASFVPTGDTIDVATRESSLEAILSEFYEIAKKSEWVTHKVTLDRENSRCWNDAMCLLIMDRSSDCEISCRRLGEEFVLEIFTDEGKLFAILNLVDQVHAPLILTVPEECVKPMLENKCQVLQSMQNEATLSCYFDRIENALYVYGLSDRKKAGEKIFTEFIDSVRQAVLQFTVKTIPIASDEIGRLIGPKGRVMNSIRDKAGIEEIRISEIDKCVFIVGSALGIDHAVSLIEEELSAKKDATVVQIGLAESEAMTMELLAKKEGKNTSNEPAGFMGNRVDEWSRTAAAPSVQVPVAIDNVDAFPSLAAVKPSIKHKFKRPS